MTYRYRVANMWLLCSIYVYIDWFSLMWERQMSSLRMANDNVLRKRERTWMPWLRLCFSSLMDVGR